MLSQKRIFLVANSHIDPVWLWDKYEGIDEVINTFRSACDRLDEYPELKFSASSICFYKWVEEYAPGVFKRIKARVLAGRWVETDCNLPTVESFYKSAEISKKYLSSRFGIETPVAYCPDSFGHAATLPKILANSSFKYYIFCRPDERDKPDLPGNLFYWKYGNKCILCYRLKYHYTQGLLFNPQHFESALTDTDLFTDGLACYFFGVGDHGGGPIKDEIEYFIKKKPEVKDTTLKFSTCLEFFKEAEKLKNIPTYTGDLHNHAIGCYSINRVLKQAIRDAEHLLCYTQRVSDTIGKKSPVELNLLWEKTIFNQFHDIMPGSCSPSAAKQVLAELGGVQDACLQISYNALKKMSFHIPVKCYQGEFRIFSSLPEPVTCPFEIESFMYFRPGSPFKDSSGRVIPIQEITSSVNCVNRRWLFVDTIPAKTMKSYYFDSNEAPSLVQDKKIFYTAGKEVTNSRFKIESPGNITDRHFGYPFFKTPISLGVIKDDTDTWSHGIEWYGHAIDHFKEVSSAIREGPIASFLISRQKFGSSEAELRFAIYNSLPFVDMWIKVRWNEERSILKLEIESNTNFDSFLVKGPGGVIEKKTDGIEEPLHGWLLAGELGILQDGAFAFDRQGNKIRITLVRSSLYGYDKFWILDPLGPIERTDIGEHRFRFRFIKREGLASTLAENLYNGFIEPFRIIRES